MRKGLLVGLLWTVPVLSYAVVMSPEQPDAIRPVINQVNYQTSVEGWVASQTAEVVVNVSASLTEDQLAKAHTDILDKLNGIAKADWHITQFNRTPSQSGLEQLQVEATARLPESDLINVRSTAKKISKEGQTFTVGDINFEPTLADTIAERETLREEIYQQIQKELTTLNKIYPNQRYVVHQINFREDMMSPQPVMRAMVVTAAGSNGGGESAPVNVQNKLVMTANVSLASVNQ
ncbi:MAG TPA: hypothetical protein VGV92_05425 [Gammaproteobacteria bacterium]|nr:hypothetical protein [Gammaproteobacteria bacterium]